MLPNMKGEICMIFDTHAHYDDEQFDKDREEVLASMEAQGVGTIVNVSATLNSCSKAVDLAERYPHVYAAVGIHPDEVGSLNEDTFLEMKKLFQRDKVVAVGEIGLDYYWDNESHETQKKWFVRQMELAREQKLPILVHSRDAAADTLYLIKEYGKDLSGVIHCFSYSAELAKTYVKLGYYIGVGGVVTFKNAKKMKEVVEAIPLEKILLETDCPYLAPEPYRGKRNQSGYLNLVAEAIAAIKGMTSEEVIKQTRKNAEAMYGINFPV